MTHKEALIKSLVWRVFIAVPFSFVISYIYLDKVYEAVEMTIVANVLVTVLYYAFDILWFRWSDRLLDKE